MTTTQVQFRRGNSTDVSTFIGASGEVVVNTDTNQVIVQDGNTVGGITGARIIDLNNRISNVIYTSGVQSVTGQKLFLGTLGVTSIDSYSGVLYTNTIVGFTNTARKTIDYQNYILYDNNLLSSLEWDIRTLNDTSAVGSLSWGNRFLYDSSDNISLDWNNRILSGNWTAQSLYISGVSVVGGGGGGSGGGGPGSLYSTGSFNLNVSNANGNITLASNPVYINTGASTNITWTLPLLSSCSGRLYKIKNCGYPLLLSGSSSDQIFYTYPVSSFTINSGEAYEVINNSLFWCVM